MGLAVFLLDGWLATGLGLSAGKLAWGLRSLAGMTVGALVYLPLAAAMGVGEIRWALELVRGRLGLG